MDSFNVSDRRRLATELIAAIPEAELNRMFPPAFRDKSHEEIFEAIRSQLECMSRERIESLLKGEEHTSGESSAEEEEEEDVQRMESEEEHSDEDEEIEIVEGGADDDGDEAKKEEKNEKEVEEGELADESDGEYRFSP